MSIKALAAAVLRQAVCDAAGLIERRGYVLPANPGPKGGRLGRRPRDAATKEAVQAEAYAWLTTPGQNLEFWCGVVGISMYTVIDGVDGAIATVKKKARAPGAGRPRQG